MRSSGGWALGWMGACVTGRMGGRRAGWLLTRHPARLLRWGVSPPPPVGLYHGTTAVEYDGDGGDADVADADATVAAATDAAVADERTLLLWKKKGCWWRRRLMNTTNEGFCP